MYRSIYVLYMYNTCKYTFTYTSYIRIWKEGKRERERERESETERVRQRERERDSECVCRYICCIDIHSSGTLRPTTQQYATERPSGPFSKVLAN